MYKSAMIIRCMYASMPCRLIELLEKIFKDKENKTLIFAETKRRADELTRGMRKSGYPAAVIHGDKSQTERDWVLRGNWFSVVEYFRVFMNTIATLPGFKLLRTKSCYLHFRYC